MLLKFLPHGNKYSVPTQGQRSRNPFFVFPPIAWSKIFPPITGAERIPTGSELAKTNNKTRQDKTFEKIHNQPHLMCVLAKIYPIVARRVLLQKNAYF